MKDQYALYAKGFVGSRNIVHQVIMSSKEIQTVGIDSQWQQSQMHLANKDVVQAFVAMRQYPLRSVDFEYRENTIKAILHAFGGPYLDSWFAANYLMGRMSDSRIQFLTDTVKFVLGQERAYPVDMYLTYIGLATEHTYAPKRFEKEIGDLLGCTDPHFAIKNNSVKTTDFVQTWLARPGGFRDMVISAMVLWGDDTVS